MLIFNYIGIVNIIEKNIDEQALLNANHLIT